MLPAIDDLAELRAPVAEMVVGNHLVSEEAGHAGEALADQGAPQMPDVHRLGDVRAAEVDDNLPG